MRGHARKQRSRERKTCTTTQGFGTRAGRPQRSDRRPWSARHAAGLSALDARFADVMMPPSPKAPSGREADTWGRRIKGRKIREGVG